MKIKLIIAMSILLLATGCKDGGEYDGLLLKTPDGKFYLAVHSLGDAYFLRPINDDQLANIRAQAAFVTEPKQ